mmetsp:Transcript_16283/g.28452  ORF Transcript_16283/g.28452 Transcript_16283/m.28452 type:complete len:101 (+) Transcript_16283:1037-1339(+)
MTCVAEVSLAEGHGGEVLETLAPGDSLGEAGALRVRTLLEDLGRHELRTEVFGETAGLAGTMAADAAAASDSRLGSNISSAPSSPSNDSIGIIALLLELG